MIDHAIYSEEAKTFVSSKLQRLAEILYDYDPTLELRWIPPNARSQADSLPYCIVHNIIGQKPYVVKYFSELDDPVSILAQLFAGDNRNNNVLKTLEAQEAAQKAFEMKAWMEQQEEMADKFHFLYTNRSKNWVNWRDPKTGEKVKLDEFRRRQNPSKTTIWR